MLKNYQYLEHTSSLCPICLKRTDAKIIEKEGSIFLLKYCPNHGEFCELLEEDASWYNNRRIYDKPGNCVTPQTERKNGCPYDCGICPDHEQHTCIGLIEVTNRCNLQCPVCFANSGKDELLSKEDFEKMLDFLVDSEGGELDILQISGGEPTLHPEIISFIELARSKNIHYVMLNTNGIRLAEDIKLVEALSRFRGGFEVYLQFDGFDNATYQYLRGKPLLEAKLKAIKNLTEHRVPITLVTTLERGVNDQEIGKIIEYALSVKYIRGINFQPVGYFGRTSRVDTRNRLTLTGVLHHIEKQMSGMLRKSDFIPLPCNVDRVAITYLYRDKSKSFIPLMRDVETSKYLPFIKNTFRFDPGDFLKELRFSLFSKDCCNIAGFFRDFSKVLPINYLLKDEEEKIEFVSENTFRISVTSFIDAYNMDVKSLQKECVHIVTPDLRKIPFSSYNIFRR